MFDVGDGTQLASLESVQDVALFSTQLVIHVGRLP